MSLRPILAVSLLLAASETFAQSIVRFADRNISVVPGTGPALPSYKMRFGTFAAGFAPTLENFSQWDANFNGSTGAHTPGVSSTMDFTANDNSVHTLGSTLYLMVFNVAPNAATSTATSAALLTRDGWTVPQLGWFDILGEDRRGRPIMVEVKYNYQFGFVGSDTTTSGFRNFDEDNYLPLTDLSAFSSPFNDLSILNGGVGISSTFIVASPPAVPEPSAMGLGVLALAAAALVRRRQPNGRA